MIIGLNTNGEFLTLGISMCEGVRLGLGFKRELVRARYMRHVESHFIHDM